jgi:hypothetical protein
MTIYFINHFYFGSEINSISVSGRSIEEAEKQMASKLQAYSLNLKERGSKSEQILAGEIGLRYSPDGQVKGFKDKQIPLEWVTMLFNTDDSKMTLGVSYDENLLKERIDRLFCLDGGSVIEPKNPILRYAGSGYEIVNEVNGNKVDKQTELDLESIDCYIKPQYTSKSQKIAEVKGMLNQYVSSKITYTFGEQKEIIDGSIINKWLKVEENYGVIIDEAGIKKYVDTLSKTHTRIGNLTNFNTTSGKTINVSGGDYKCYINTEEEVKDLISIIKEGQSITKEPKYTLDTYVEIDLTQQHLWFYKDKSLVIDGDIVSGNAGGSLATPEGIYKLRARVRNAVLRGPGYAAPVSFWMPFNGGIGMHDATWRRAFGGNIYKGDGSHGCINCSYSLAETIFENIEVGTPVICFY